MISVGGSWGTLSEIALAGRGGDIPAVCLAGWQVSDRTGSPVMGLVHAATPEEAVTTVLAVRYP